MKKTKFDLLLMLKKLKKNKSLANLNFLNVEEKKLSKIQVSLGELLKTSELPKNILLSSIQIRQISNYQNQLQEKLTITHNRNQYIKNEIKNNLMELSKINKQKENIEKKITENKKEIKELKEIKSEVLLINRSKL